MGKQITEAEFVMPQSQMLARYLDTSLPYKGELKHQSGKGEVLRKKQGLKFGDPDKETWTLMTDPDDFT